MARPRKIPETHLSLDVQRWASRFGVDLEGHADGADVHYEGSSPAGAIRITAKSAFIAEVGVEALCLPRLFRVEVGRPEEVPRAWAPVRLFGEGVGIIAISAGGTVGVLHAPEYEAVEFLLPRPEARPVPEVTNPFAETMLERVVHISDGSWATRRRRLWAEAEASAEDLVVRDDHLAWAFVQRAASLTGVGTTGALILGATAALAGVALPLTVPVAAAVGAAAGIGLGLHGAARAARVKLWPTTAACLQAVEATDLFRKVTVSPEREHAWSTHVLIGGSHRDIELSSLEADNRIEAVGAGGELTLRIDTYHFPTREGQDPLGVVAPQRWSTVRVRLPEGTPAGAVGRLEPIEESPDLVCWLTGEEVEDGALHEEVLAPLAQLLQQGRRGPYR